MHTQPVVIVSVIVFNAQKFHPSNRLYQWFWMEDEWKCLNLSYIFHVFFTILCDEQVEERLGQCWFSGYTHMLGTIFQAFMSMFQILTQEGWVEVVQATLYASEGNYFIMTLIRIYFVLYHQFAGVVSDC